MKITILTPVYNAASKLPRTMHSILNQDAVQAGTVELEYIVCDGASSDGSADVARGIGGEHVTVYSERDRNMYDALAKGFGRATGDVISWLNAGDWYHPGAFTVLADLFADPSIEWITGMSVLAREDGAIVRARNPYRFRSRLLRAGAYGRYLPFVQQESTFWRRSLLDHVPMETFVSFERAGDAYLWSVLAEHATLHSVYSMLGSFTVEPGQLSENRGAYFGEYDQFARRMTPVDWACMALDVVPWTLRWRFDALPRTRYLHTFDRRQRTWRHIASEA